MADLRAAAASDPENARVLSMLALVTLDAEEAKRLGAAAALAYPFGADVLIEAGLGRLKCDRGDAEAAKLLARGLALDPGLLSYAAFHATALQLDRELALALPDLATHREWAKKLVARHRLDLLGEELDALAALEDGRPIPSPPAATEGARTVAIVKPDAWLEKDGFAIARLGAIALPLAGHRASVTISEPGTLLVETSLVGPAPAFVCVLLDGKHLGHILVSGDWSTQRFALPKGGEVVLEGALKHHALVGGAPDEGVLVRDVAVIR